MYEESYSGISYHLNVMVNYSNYQYCTAHEAKSISAEPQGPWASCFVVPWKPMLSKLAYYPPVIEDHFNLVGKYKPELKLTLALADLPPLVVLVVLVSLRISNDICNTYTLTVGSENVPTSISIFSQVKVGRMGNFTLRANTKYLEQSS